MATGRPWICDPAGPGADVEGGGDAGQLQCEYLVRRGDTRAAVRPDGAILTCGDAKGRESPGQLTTGQEPSPRGEVARGRHAQRARNVPGDRVDGLGLPAVALGRARVEQEAGTGQGRRPGGIQDRHLAGNGGEVSPGPIRSPGQIRSLDRIRPADPIRPASQHRLAGHYRQGRPRPSRGSRRPAPAPGHGRNSAGSTTAARRRLRPRRHRPRPAGRIARPRGAWPPGSAPDRAAGACPRRPAGRPGPGPGPRRRLRADAPPGRSRCRAARPAASGRPAGRAAGRRPAGGPGTSR